MKPAPLIAASILLGVLGSSQTAEARIVYTPVNESVSAPGTLSIDLDNDGDTEFALNLGISGTGACYTGYVNGTSGKGDGIASESVDLNYWASALDFSVPIGQNLFFAPNYTLLTQYALGPYCFEGGFVYGYWFNAGPHYLGLSFVKNGKTRYGWAALSVTWHKDFFQRQQLTATLTGYAYQTNAGQYIPAGKM